MYTKELNSITKSNRLRERKIFDDELIDLASNDYLGLGVNKTLLENAYQKLLTFKSHSPKASILVNGYSPIHKEFEDNLCKANKFEAGIVVGSGFLANISLIEALVRKGDKLFIDEEYHASGMVATKMLEKNQVVIFNHNDANHLKELLEQTPVKGRRIIAIEGVYSMHGDVAPKEIFDLSDKYESVLVVDEAHSSGVLGENLLGIFDFYNITPKPNHIKMGTLGKAYGSYGAYILSSKEINQFLTNRAKPIIYSTAPSLFDIALGNEALKYILQNSKALKSKITQNLEIVKNILSIKSDSLIIPIVINDNKKVMEIQKVMLENGFVVGAIREPTVKKAIIRLIAKIDINPKDLEKACKILNEYN